MQEESASIYLIEDAGPVLGVITLEDVLERVVGQLEDEDGHDKPLMRADKQERRESLMNAVTQAELLEIIGKPVPGKPLIHSGCISRYSLS